MRKTLDLKSCSVCAKAKARCDMVPGQAKCARCARLNKDCALQPRGSHSRRAVAPRNHGRQHSLPLQPKSGTSTRPLTPGSAHLVDPSCSNASTSQDHSTRSAIDDAFPPRSSIFTDPERRASEMLNLYRNDMMPLFPFVILSPHMTPAELFRGKPVLFMIIIAVTCQHDVELQSRLCNLCRTEIGHRIWDQSEVSLDLLQAILVFIAWRHVHVHLGSKLSSLIHSAIALAVDLDIYHEPRQAAKARLGALDGSEESIGNGESRTLEQRRAQLGLFWLSSVLSACLQDVAGVKSSSSVANSCHILEQAKELPSDLHLVRLIQLQITAETVIAAISEGDGSNNLTFSGPAMFDLLGREVKKADPSHLLPSDRSSSVLLSLSYGIVRLLLYRSYLDEVSHSMSHDDLHAHGIKAAARCTSLVFSTADAAKAAIIAFLALDSYTLLSLPYPHWIQMGHAIRTLARILAMKSEASEALPAVDLLKLLEQVPSKVEEVFSRGMQCHMPRSLPAIFQGFRKTVSDIARSTGVTPTEMPLDVEKRQTRHPDSDQLNNMNMGLNEEDEVFMMDLFSDGGFQLNFDPGWAYLST